MQLHACLLLFIITTDKTLALLHQRCSGNISLDQKPAGHINLTLSGLYNDTNINHMNNQFDRNLSLCTWLTDIPVGRTVDLKLVQLEGGSNISVSCVWTQEDRDQVLVKGIIARLSGCDRNKAALTWTGAGHSSVQLSYYVQEDERNSSEHRTTHHPDQNLISQTGTSFTRTAPVNQDVVRRKEEDTGHGPQSVSGPSSQEQGTPHPTTPLQGLSVDGITDRETLPLPEEGPNNGADTSGTVHLTDSRISAREGSRPYFHTQRTLRTDTSNTAKMKTISSNKLTQTQMALTDSAASNSNTMLTTDTHKSTDTHTYKHSATQAQPTVSSFSASSPPELPSRTILESTTTFGRSTDTLNSDPTSTVTSDPSKSHTKFPQDDSSSTHTETEAIASTSSSEGASRARYSTTHITEHHSPVNTVKAASFHPNTSRTDSFQSTTSDAVSQTSESESPVKPDSTMKLHTSTSSTSSTQKSTESLAHSSYTSTGVTEKSEETQTAAQSTQREFTDIYLTANEVSLSLDTTTADHDTTTFTSLSSTSMAALTLGDVFHSLAGTETTAEPYKLHHTQTVVYESPSTNSQTPLPPLTSTPLYTVQTHTMFSDSSHTTHAPSPLTSFPTDHKNIPVPLQTSTVKSTSSHTPHNLPLLSSTAHRHPHNYITATHISLLSLTTARSDPELNREMDVEKGDEAWVWIPSSTTTHTSTTESLRPSWVTTYPSQRSHLTLTPSDSTSTSSWSSTTSQPPKFYIVPDQPAAIKVESIKLLLQIIVEDSRSAFTTGLKEDTTAWLLPYLQKAPGFSGLLDIWSSGHAVQNLVEFKTSGALQWLSATGSTSLLERTGLAQVVREARNFRSSKITNITLGGQQGEVCDWLLLCPSGYKCVSQLGTTNYSCSSVCHFDHCHHHGICTHHPGQLPVCRCLVGDDFWYMGQKCDVRMTQARLVGICLAILLIIVAVIVILAFVAVRRYRAILIQAKVDQTRSSYRRFNHFDELSGRFWLRSWAGSADSLDNPAFTRSDELLHLRALDRPCCYHDDTLSLASTCPSHATRINTIYPHSSQYAWRGSEMSMGDGVLDSGKASDLSVCSWPVEPIQWTPFPLLQQLASHRTPAVRVTRPRSYCEGMELVDLEKSWTA